MSRAFSIAWLVFFIAGIAAKDVTCIGWEIWYISNKSYVASILCENKDKPAMKCNGQCYLAKQLKKAGQEEQGAKQSAPSRQLKLKAVDWIPGAFSYEADQTCNIPCCSSGLHRPERTEPTSDFSPSIFHPPAA